MEDALTSNLHSELEVESHPLILRLTESIVTRNSEFYGVLEQQLQQTKTHSLSLKGFLSGTIAGAFGVLVGHPLDTLKTRAQVASTMPAVPPPPPPASTIPNAISVSKTAQIRALYRGILGPLASAGVLQAVNFGIYDNCRNALGFNSFWSGAIAGGTLSFVNTPVGLVKVQEQVLPVSQRSSTLGRAKAILKGPKPIKSLYTGFAVNGVSESFGRGVYMWVYDSVKRYFADPTANSADDVNVANLPLSKRILAAGAAGTASWFSIYPLDVIKSRMQSAPILRGKPYKSTLDCVQQTIRAEGVSALFRGLSFTLLRSAPVASVVLPIYDLVYVKLGEYLD